MSSRNTHGKPNPVAGILGKNRGLEPLLKHAQYIARFEQALGKLVDAPIKDHCRVTNVTEQTVTLEVDSPVWRQRIRFMIPELERQFRRRINIKVKPDAIVPTRPVERPRLSLPAAQALDALAESVDDPRLRASLNRLAARHRGESP